MLDIQPFLHAWAYPFLALVLTGLSIWLVGRTTQWLDAHAAFLDAKTRASITDTEERALTAAAQTIEAWAQSTGDKVHPSIDNPILRWGAQIALNHASGILADNGASPDEIAAKLLAKLPPNVVSADTTGATIKTISVQVSTLKPIGVNS